MKLSVMFAVSAAAFAALADVQLVDSVVITSDTTVTDLVTGPGGYIVRNGAKLTLAHEDNTFAGGIAVENGIVEATASGALGVGQITLETSAARRTIRLDAADGVFPNPIVLKDVGASESYPSIDLVQSATLSGIVSVDQEMTDLRNQSFAIKLGQSTADTAVKLTFDNQVLAGTGGILVVGWGQADFKEKVTCGNYRGMNLGNGNWSQRGTVRLYSSANDIGRISISGFMLRCEAAHVIDNVAYNLYYPKAWGIFGGGILATRYPQDFALFTASNGSEIDYSASDGWGVAIRNEDSTTLQDFRLIANDKNGGGSGRCYFRFYGPINLVMTNAMTSTGKYYMGFIGRDQDQMTGRIEVGGNCQFRCLNGCRFSNVTNLLMRSGAEMTFEAISGFTTPVGNTFTSLTDIRLEGTAFIRTDAANTVNPINSPSAELRMDADSRIYLKPGVSMTVKRLFVDGELLPPGDYSSENLEQLRHWSDSFNGGVLHVLKGSVGLSITIR